MAARRTSMSDMARRAAKEVKGWEIHGDHECAKKSAAGRGRGGARLRRPAGYGLWLVREPPRRGDHPYTRGASPCPGLAPPRRIADTSGPRAPPPRRLH